ncbi:sulfotransferase domain-containing protein [Henriciella algicola]|uniref:Sulfotransferase n=1 Tax=Henriciella algicola TaxID=1608422 RepID=A0A399RTX2_9PROT|nr:sulfotransferase domain-containing protein [Henriciella algicola]RIJ33322.1 sulfotransferase [Henriciella algicola]
MPKRIDFMIAGVQKGGTTSLDAYLRQHPGISMAKKKEVHFFDKRPPTHIPFIDYAVYHRQFEWPRQAEGAKLGEATPILTWWTGSLERLWRYNPEIKVITLLRDPVERAWSHFRMDKRLQREGASFSDAIRTERERARRSLPKQDRERSQLARGYYAQQVRSLQRLFRDDQLLFLRSEYLSKSPQETLDKVTDFIGVDRFAFEPEPRHNSASDDESLSPPDRAFLEDAYKFDAQETRRLLGWDKWPWSV